jgi:hypothetical protein
MSPSSKIELVTGARSSMTSRGGLTSGSANPPTASVDGAIGTTAASVLGAASAGLELVLVAGSLV